MIITIHLSTGLATPSGMLQSSGYQILPPQYLYSEVGGNLPTFAQFQLPQQGTAHDHCLILPSF